MEINVNLSHSFAGEYATKRSGKLQKHFSFNPLEFNVYKWEHVHTKYQTKIKALGFVCRLIL